MNVSTISITVNEDSLALTQFSSVTGIISINIGNEYFPEEIWNDFIITILYWWLSEARKLSEQEENTIDCCFMDGSYGFSLWQTDDTNKWGLTFHEDINQKVFDSEIFYVSKDQFLNELACKVHIVLGFCQKRQWANIEIDGLTKLYQFDNAIH